MKNSNWIFHIGRRHWNGAVPKLLAGAWRNQISKRLVQRAKSLAIFRLSQAMPRLVQQWEIGDAGAGHSRQGLSGIIEGRQHAESKLNWVKVNNEDYALPSCSLPFLIFTLICPPTTQTHVQKLIMKESSEIYSLIKQQNAHIYVCGDVQMAEDVYRTLM